METQFNKERTLLIVKPDAVQRSLIGEILSRIERTGLKFVGFKFVVPERQLVIDHYNKDDEWFEKKGQGIVESRKKESLPIEKEAIEYGRDIIEANVRFMMSSPVLAVVIEGAHAVDVVKKLVGGTEPKTSDVGTLRSDYTIDSYDMSAGTRSVRNLAHCSDQVDEAKREISLWFTAKELMEYKIVQEKILYDQDIFCIDSE